MRLPRPAVALLALGALTLTLVDAAPGAVAAPTATAAPATSQTRAGRAALDPAHAVRPSRAVAATLPPSADGSTSGGTARITANPVTGRLCTVGTGFAPAVDPATGQPAPASYSGLALAAPDGTRLALADASLQGCASASPAEAAALLGAPATYQVVLTGAAGDLAAAPPAAAPALGRPWAVGTRTETVLDSTRGTARRGRVAATHSRVIRLTYYYPEPDGAAGPGDRAGAPASDEGPFPVVLFSPGYAVTPQTYERTLHAWAAAGYLVVGVLSPGSGGGLPGTPTEADLGAQPGDLALALSRVARHAADPASWLGGVPDLSRVAVSGHSDGGSTAAAAGLLQRFSDSRYDAVLVLAGASFGGAKARRALPLLVVSGQDDEYNRPVTFQHVFDLGRATRTWVQAVGARHLPPFVVAGKQADTLRALEIAFLDRSLLGAATAPAERQLATERGVTRIAAGRF